MRGEFSVKRRSMHYNGPIVRPQTDADSLFIEVTVGCTHNSCTFCNFYKGYPFSIAPLEQIEADLKEARQMRPWAKKIWANGGNPYALSTDRLAAVAKLIKQYFPQSRISTYARVDDLTRKSADEMKYLKELGFEDLVVGFETGDDEILKAVNKGYTVADILSGCKKLEEAGVDYRMIFLGGLAGKGKCEESAKKTAALLNQLHPYLLYLNSVSIMPGTKLYEDWKQGVFQESGERELVKELISLLEHMENEIAVFAAPNTTPFSFFVNLQENKHKLLCEMQNYLCTIDKNEEKRAAINRHRKSNI